MSARPASAAEASPSSGSPEQRGATALTRLCEVFVTPRAAPAATIVTPARATAAPVDTAAPASPAAMADTAARGAATPMVDTAARATRAPTVDAAPRRRPGAALIRRAFVRPAAVRKTPAAAPRRAARIALVCAAEDAAALGVAAASILVRRHRADCALACVWAPEGASRALGESGPLAGRAARRLANALAARDVPSTARGRLAIAAPPGDPATSSAPAAARALAAAGAAPTVLALGGPRERAFDALLADQDLVVVATRPSASGPLADLALAAVADVATRVVACEVGPTPAGRLLATAGVRIPRALRRALSAPLEAVA
jgi:hypothetical protein